jgi:hypothetical protein
VRDRGREEGGKRVGRGWEGGVGKDGERGEVKKTTERNFQEKKGERWSRLVGMRKKMYMILWD